MLSYVHPVKCVVQYSIFFMVSSGSVILSSVLYMLLRYPNNHCLKKCYLLSCYLGVYSCCLVCCMLLLWYPGMV